MHEVACKASMDLAERKLREEPTKEEALHNLINAGILDSSGNPTK